jgi:hypothetical protein
MNFFKNANGGMNTQFDQLILPRSGALGSAQWCLLR